MGKLKNQIVKGISWVTLYIYAVRITGFITTLILAKLLTPEDFGLVAIGVLVIEMTMIFGKFGIGQALIYRKEQVEQAANAALFLVLGFNLILVVGIILGAPFIGDFFNNRAVTPIIIWLSITMLPNALKIVPTVLLEKSLKFKRLVLPEVLPAVLSAAGAIIAAYLGAGVWSLVIRQVIYSFLGLIIIWLVSPIKINLNFDWKIFREVINYGKHMITASLMLLVLYNIDNMIVGKIVGTTALGFYVLAFRIANLPVQEGSHVISKVMFPVFSRLQDDRQALAGGFLKVIKFVSAFSAPIAIGMAVYTPDLIRFVYGEKWLAVIVPLQILTFYGFIRALGVPGGEIMKSLGKPKFITYTVLVMLSCILPFVIPVAKSFGIVGISVLMGGAMLVGNCFALFNTTRFLKIKVTALFPAIGTPLLLAAATILTGYLPYYMHWLPHSIFSIVLSIFLSSGLYLISLYFFEQKFRQELFAMIGIKKQDDAVEKRIKIAHIITGLGIGGAERFLRTLALAVDRKKYDLHFFCIVTGGELVPEFEKLGYHVRVIPCYNWNRRLPFRFVVTNILKLAIIFKKEKFQIVHTHLYRANMIGRIAAILAGIPYLYATEHNTNSWKKKVDIFWDKLLARFTNKIIAVSEYVKDFTIEQEQLQPNKLLTLWHGIWVKDFDEVNGRPQTRTRLGFGLNQPIIGSIGRLVPQKGYRYFLEAMPKILNRFPDTQFMIIGDGPLKDELQELSKYLGLQANLKLPGFRNDIPQLLKAMDAFVMTSLWEGFGIVLIEAMACSLPVVATNVGPVPEIVKDGETGFLVEPEHADQVADSVIKLLENPELLQKLGLNGRKRLNTFFTAEKMIENLEQIYSHDVELVSAV